MRDDHRRQRQHLGVAFGDGIDRHGETTDLFGDSPACATVGDVDGRVEVLELDGAARFRVRPHGSLYDETVGNGRGIYRTVDQVAAVLGDAFAQQVSR